MPQQERPATEAQLADVRTELKAEISAVRTELKADFARVVVELAQTKAELKQDIAVLRDDFHQFSRKMDTRQDTFLNKIETMFREFATLPATVDAHGKTLRSHETRLTRLESKSS